MKRSAAVTFLAAAPLVAAPAGAQDFTTVTVGIPNTSSDAPLFIAQKLGYFRAVGIEAKFIPFRGSPEMIAPLGTGQLDVAAGAPAGSIYNAVASNIDIKMVADKAIVAPGFGYGPLMVRKDLVTSGRYKTPHDLKGMKVAEATPGTANGASLGRLIELNGLRYSDFEHVYIAFPQMAAAFANGAIDAAVSAEPSAMLAERQGDAVRVASNDKWYPNQEQSVIIYGATFQKKRDLAVRFLVGYLQGLRYYYNALSKGHFTGPNAEKIIDILVEFTPLKDRSIYRDMVTNSVNPNGNLNLVSLASDLFWFKQQGFVKSDVALASAIDTSYLEEALRKVGRYQAPAR